MYTFKYNNDGTSLKRRKRREQKRKEKRTEEKREKENEKEIIKITTTNIASGQKQNQHQQKQ